MNNILGVSSPLYHIMMPLINPVIFGLFYNLPILSKTTNVKNQHKQHQMQRDIST